jgi:hypothetical protein
MTPPLPPDLFGEYNVEDEFLHYFDFAAEFDFGLEFSSATVASYFAGDVDYDGISVTCSRDDVSTPRDASGRKKRSPNRQYRIRSVRKSCWYMNFLKPGETRDLQLEMSSSDRDGEFRCAFRMSLEKVEQLTKKLIARGYIPPPRSLRRRDEYPERCELLVMSALHILGTGAPYRSLYPLTHISKTEIEKFFHRFLDMFMDMREEYIYMPKNIRELDKIAKWYSAVGLPGACGSIDVVHVKWSNCPAGDFNRAKGKEGYPSLGFQCISDFNRRILGVYGPQFGSTNDKQIVKTDTNVRFIRFGWLSKVAWRYWDERGRVRWDRGMYLICDNGYLRWPQSICPYMSPTVASSEGYFSSNLESVRKDVECTFGILKKRWKILNHGLLYRDIKVCEKIFVTAVCLNNMLVDDVLVNYKDARVGRGAPLMNDGMWLDGHTTPPSIDKQDKHLAKEFGKRRLNLAIHLRVMREKGPIPSD